MPDQNPNQPNPATETSDRGPDLRVAAGSGAVHPYLLFLFLSALLGMAILSLVRGEKTDCWQFLGFGAALMVSPETVTAAIKRRSP